ncbi:MAG: DUF3667 domain-containing protein [Maribacter sp.]
MECKNCQTILRTDYSFCPDCGAKVIRNRLTIKNLFRDVTERYFNVDNTFLKTFWHLFTKPELVIEGYIKGIRRKYLNPVSYIGIALTLSGLIVFLVKKKASQIDFDIFGVGTSVASEKAMEITFDFQAILFVLYIPMMAIAAWLCFQEKKYNFSERLVIFTYTLAHYSIFIFVPSILVLVFSAEYYGSLSTFALLFMYCYSAFVIKRISNEKGASSYAKILLFWVLFTILYSSISIIIPIIMLITGEVSLQDFKPIKM